jgi:hypothetical protein
MTGSRCLHRIDRERPDRIRQHACGLKRHRKELRLPGECRLVTGDFSQTSHASLSLKRHPADRAGPRV